MAQISLTLEEKEQIIEALNNDTEPSPDLIPKLFPATAEKFDVVALDRAKIPTLEYAGKRSKAIILAEAIAGIGAAPLQVVRSFGESKSDEWCNMIVQGDNLQFLKTCYKNVDLLIKDKVKGKVKLIYIDPPFATKSDFGGSDGEYSYADKVERARFLESLRERLIYLRELLTDDGSIYVHLDQKMSHYAKIVLDEVFGKDNFVNEVIWNFRTYQGQTTSYYPQKHNSIFWYISKKMPPEFELKYDDLGEDTVDYRRWEKYIVNGGEIRGNRYPSGDSRFMSYYNRWVKENGHLPKKDDVIMKVQGYVIDDVWIDIPAIDPKDQEEKVNYPTQKPEMLLERIISSVTKKGDLVLDAFAGSGTTLAVSEKLERRWIGCDFGKHAIYTIQKRLLNIKLSNKLGTNPDAPQKYGIGPTPFSIVSSGTYDFTHVMDLRKSKNTYVDFVLGLFQLSRDEEKAGKFMLGNIFAVRNGHPVEVYPVWDDRYLKDIRIDEIYLQGIIDQSGGKLRGEYCVITPESCTNIGDTTLKNQEGKDVEFKILSFPYKILEDISQKLKLQEQPSSSRDINSLITSTSFYFNENIEIEAERSGDGFKITKFETKILDGTGNRFAGLSGLAMLLIDLNYEEGKPFDVDMAIYSKDIGEDGVSKVADLTASVGIIAIDKHGNESKPYKLA